VLGEHGAAVGLDFAEGDGSKSACSLKSKAEPSDPTEQI
jgi:hypothetical protein